MHIKPGKWKTEMFGPCFYLPLSSANISASPTNDLPLDLSCKPKGCERNSNNLYFLEFPQSSKNNSQTYAKSKGAAVARDPASFLQFPCETKNNLPQFISPQNKRVESDSNAISFSKKEKNPSKELPTLPITESNSQPTPKRSREKTFLPCQVCGKSFDRPSLLKRHIRTHTGEKPHICDVCGKGFSTSSSLNTHRRIHSGEKPHKCPVCGKRFTASSNLYYHRMTHVKEKPHKCTMCQKSFPTPGDLKSHMYVHNGSWPFQCHVCNRGFSKQTNLRNHLFLHTGKKPHNCSQCGKCFALACNLRAHMRTHSVTDSCHLNRNTDQVDAISVVEDSNVKPEDISISEQKLEIENCIDGTPRLTNHVLFWQTIQQQLATKIMIQQQQIQKSHLNLISTQFTRSQTFSK